MSGNEVAFVAGDAAALDAAIAAAQDGLNRALREAADARARLAIALTVVDDATHRLRDARAARDMLLPRAEIHYHGGVATEVRVSRRSPTSIWVRVAGDTTERRFTRSRREWREHGVNYGRSLPPKLVLSEGE